MSLCAGESSGKVFLTGSGGTQPYQYSFDNTNYLVQDSFVNLAAGTYQYYVQDDAGCVDSTGVSISEPAVLMLNLVNEVDLLCFDVPSGSVEVLGSGGVAPYQYSIDRGMTYNTSPLFGELAEGAYNVLVQDANGCLAEVEAELEQPTDLVGDVMKTDITCFGDSNGVAEVLVMGGTLGYSFEWSNGETGPRVQNLGPGNYIAAVTDANGCQISLSTEIFEPPLFEFDSTLLDSVTCFGGSDGRLEVQVSGGLYPYTYSWSNGGTDSILMDIPGGDYTFIATDSNNCSIDTLLNVPEPEPIVINLVDAGGFLL